MPATLENMTGLKRTHYCGEIGLELLGREVVIMGWVQYRRDHGGLVFIDLRDRTGLVQTVFNPEEDEITHRKSHDVRAEYVLALSGLVRARPDDMVNPNLATGRVEVFIRELRVLNTAQTPPFVVDDHADVSESVRLKYRYLDLRRPMVLKNFILRHQVAKLTRDYFAGQGFLEVETPVLTKSTPEGARDYLVPSRLNPGAFYALPQSPQIFKQLLMVAGVDRYCQIVKCFRDEDLRADRQPEFTQVDLEMSFVEPQDVMEMLEGCMAAVFRGALNLELPRPFPRLTYETALMRYGLDRPDLRYGLEIVEVSHILTGCQAKVFAESLFQGGCVRAIRAPGAAAFSRKQLDDLVAFAIGAGARGLAWIKLADEGWQGPLVKFLTEGERTALAEALGACSGDVIFFGADAPAVAASVLGQVRVRLAQELNLIREGDFKFAWVTDFPMFEYDAQARRFAAVHHPFTAPREADLEFLASAPERVLAQAYDLVLNGHEIGGGSIRIHRPDVQAAVFRVMGLEQAEAREKFGFLLDALAYGAPPHGGCALGLDRLTMLMAGALSLRDVIAFPKTQKAACPLTEAPGPVEPGQLLELSLRLKEKAS
ncbi:MAG: aspartate--tRNA ligase [Deltaproteobacteria bacterium]|nr:aspartate--tRNA ligase [Deltaproteobacteria bacterium]